MTKLNTEVDTITQKLVGNQSVIPNQAASEVGIWIFILGDMLLFTVIFGSYAYDRGLQHELFLQSEQLLNQTYAIVNTILLLTGSLFVIIAVHLARQGPSPWIRRLIFAAMTTGILFFINKIIEYSEKISADITLFTNDFFLYYYMITGLHMLHVLVGTGILLYLYNRLNKRILLDSDQEALTNGGAVWHMVDLLWIVLFALIYLIK